jgi:OmpA-OmpF porin, OOP family
MKPTLLALYLSFVLASGLWAQTSSAPHAVSYRMALLDHFTPQLRFLEGKVAANDLRTLGVEMGYARHLNRSFDLFVPLRIAKADLSGDPGIGSKEAFWMNLDLQARLKLLDNDHWLNPFLFAGIGGVYHTSDQWSAQVPLGAGLHIRLADGFFASLQAEYRMAESHRLNNMHFLGGFSIAFGSAKAPAVRDTDGDGVPDHEDDCPLEAGLPELNGCPDRDGDGIPDKDDACPDQPGPAALQGCPDRDGDGIPDKDDACPDHPGPAALKGCPDQDGDGIPDKDDDCPTKAGPASLRGCPDRDGDGIPDKDDRCPDEAGPAHLKGCPDRDNDGVPDIDDRCPDQPGPASNKGCPELKKEEKAIIQMAIQSVQFLSNSATLTGDSYPLLDQLVGVLLQNPAYHCEIAGHTDATGTPEHNQDLSERRARACYDYLLSKGVPSGRLSHSGWGQTRPIADNRTPEGRRANRRVEFDLQVR